MSSSDGDRLVGAGRGVVDGRVTLIVKRVGRLVEVDAAAGRAAVVLHLEGEAGVAGAVGVGRRGELQQAGGDVGHGHALSGRHRHAVELQRARAGQRRDLDRQQVVGRAVVRVGEAEVGCGEGVRGVLQRVHRRVSSRRSVVDGGDVDRDGVGRLVEIDAAVGRAAVVLHLEGEAGVARAVGVGRRGEFQQTGSDVAQLERTGPPSPPRR